MDKVEKFCGGVKLSEPNKNRRLWMNEWMIKFIFISHYFIFLFFTFLYQKLYQK